MTPEPYPATPAVPSSPVPPWRDVRVLRIAAQVAVILVVGLVVAFMARNLVTAMNERGLGFGFSFLGRSAGFDISESPIPYSSTDTYARAFLVGLLNTLFVSVVGIILATILGIVVGVARLSPNWLIRRIASGYVEVIRNTPLLVQLVIIYFAVFLQLPSVAQTLTPARLDLPEPARRLPARTSAQSELPALARLRRSGDRHPPRLADRGRSPGGGGPAGAWPSRRLAGSACWGSSCLAGSSRRRWPWDVPMREQFNFVGGLALSPEFTALLAGPGAVHRRLHR